MELRFATKLWRLERIQLGVESENNVRGKEAEQFGQDYTVQSLDEFLDAIGV
jgi:hypothetical protein